MSTETLHLFDPRRTIQLQGFSGKAATTTIHDATETGFQVSGIFQAAEDFANVQLFSAYDYFNHLRLKPLPVTDLSGVTLQFDMQALPVNGEEGNVRPDCVRYASVGWDKLTITSADGNVYEVPLMSYAQIISGGCQPGSFKIRLADRKAVALDALLVGQPTPALTDTAHVHFMGARWSCSSAEAIAECDLETQLLSNVGTSAQTSCEQAFWWADDPTRWHDLWVNGAGAGVLESGAADSAEIAARLATMVGISSYLVDCTLSGNVVTVSLEAGVNGPVLVSSSDGSGPATLSRELEPGVKTVKVSSSAEIRAGDYVAVDIGSANDEVVKVISVGAGTFTANFKNQHYGEQYPIMCRVLPRARHFGRVLKDRMISSQAPDYGEQPTSLSLASAQDFSTTNAGFEMKVTLGAALGQYGRDANGMPVRLSVDGGNQIVAISGGGDEIGDTVLTTSVQGSGNDRAYRFIFPFGQLTGFLNGDRVTLVPVPATEIVKVHLTFAPRFEDVEDGLAAGGLLRQGVAAPAADTEEEWQIANAAAMSASTKYYVGNATSEERITCLANLGLVMPDPAVPSGWYHRVLVRRGEDSSTPQAWGAGTPV